MNGQMGNAGAKIALSMQQSETPAKHTTKMQWKILYQAVFSSVWGFIAFKVHSFYMQAERACRNRSTHVYMSAWCMMQIYAPFAGLPSSASAVH
jgi:hypothetical protein